MNEEIDNIKMRLRRKAISFQTGGFRPTYQLGEGWIGKVCWQLPGDEIPLGKTGKLMDPIASIFIDNPDYVPNSLKNIKLINIFFDSDFWENGTSDEAEYREYRSWFKIDLYDSLDNLVPCDYISNDLKPFPLKPIYIENDFPNHDSIFMVDYDLEDEIFNLEDEGIDYYNDIFENNDINHKIGGFPSTIQEGIGFDDGYEYVMQIVSDEKIGLNIFDGGNFYFGYNPTTNQWAVRCDYY